jgi:O-antigen ligase/Tfp pilus assembly protein PilF
MGKRARRVGRDRARAKVGRPRAGARPRRRPRSWLDPAAIKEIISASLPPLRRGLTALFLFALPLVIYLGNTEYGYTKAILALFFISLLSVFWAVEAALRRDYRFNLTPLFLPGILLLVVAALSMINATSLGIALQSLGLLFYFFLFYLLVANIVERERELQLFLGSILAAAFLAAVYGILQYFGVFPGTPGVPRGTGAIISSLGNKNYLGGFLVCLIIPSLILPFRLGSRVLRGLSLFVLATIVYTLTLIRSDGAWLALAISGAFFIGGFLYFRVYRTVRFKRGWLIIGAALLIIGGLLIIRPSLPPGPNAVSDISRSDLPGGERLSSRSGLGIPVIDELVKFWERNSGRVRAWDWWVSWEMLKEHPILGVGLGHYKVQFLPYKAEFLATERGKQYNFYIQRAAQAHNEYVQAAAELGVLGIIAGGFVLLTIFFRGFKVLRKAEAKERFIPLALLAGVVASLTDALVSFPFHLPASALAFILLLGLLNSRYFLKGAHEFKISLRGPKSWLALAPVLVLAISVTTLAYRDWLADTYLDRGERDLKYGRVDVAEVELEKSLALDFAPSSALYWLGSIYHKLGDEKDDPALLERSRVLLEHSLTSFQVEPTYLQLAQLYLNLGEFGQAMDYVNKLLAISPEPERGLDARYLAAVIAWQRGDLEDALERLNELVAKQKDYEMAYVTRAKVYLQQGNSGLARLDLEGASKIVERKLSGNQDQLARLREQRLLTLDKYAELTNEIAQLEKEKKSIDKLLQELPK